MSGQYIATFFQKNPGLHADADELKNKCMVAMMVAIARGGSVRFTLDGMTNVVQIIAGNAFQDKVTTRELQFIMGTMGTQVVVPLGADQEVTITPVRNRNVFFYLNGHLYDGQFTGANNPYDP